jgi:hypothetical protein
MLLYEASRTKSIVDRLVALGNQLGPLITWSSALLWGALFMFLASQINRELWWLGAIIGLATGYGLGRLITTLLAAALEWMAQLLLTQSEILAHLQAGPTKTT